MYHGYTFTENSQNTRHRQQIRFVPLQKTVHDRFYFLSYHFTFEKFTPPRQKSGSDINSGDFWGNLQKKTSLREDHSQRLPLLPSASILYHMKRERRSCKAFVESVLFTIVCTSLVRDILRSRSRMSGSMFPDES